MFHKESIWAVLLWFMLCFSVLPSYELNFPHGFPPSTTPPGFPLCLHIPHFSFHPYPYKNHPIFQWPKTIHCSQKTASAISGFEITRQAEQTEKKIRANLTAFYSYSRGQSSQVFLCLPSFIQMLILKRILNALFLSNFYQFGCVFEMGQQFKKWRKGRLK